MSWFKKTIPPKPEDRVEYRLGFACEGGHCQGLQTFETDVSEGRGKVRICTTCGEKSFPAVIRQIVRPWWNECSEKWVFKMSHAGSFASFDNSEYKREFVRFLDEGTVRLPEEVVARLKDFATRTFANVDDDSEIAYKNGLHDGASMAAQYVLGELKEELS